jgi:phenylacetate-coenzyme A ligase PaaK-like adenylate-forming protein
MMLKSSINWLERYERTTDTILLFGPPSLLLEIIETLEREGKRFEFGERGTVLTAGGWKVSEDKRISAAHFRKRVEEVLGIPETCSFDIYGMVEANAAPTSCPEGHYLHLPYTWFKPLVLDSSLTPAGYGERGRYAFLDALANSYPGFIITGDEVRLLEHCPVCDRPGPVLEPDVRRAKGEEMRGCAAVVQSVLKQDLERRR